MSYEAQYSVSIFEQKDKEVLHKEFRIGSENDEARSEFAEQCDQIIADSNIDLDLIKFITLNLEEKEYYQKKFNYDEIITEIFYEDKQIRNLNDISEKIGIARFGKDSENYYQSIDYYNCHLKINHSIKITSDKDLNGMQQQLEILINAFKRKWIDEDAEKIEMIEKKLAANFAGIDQAIVDYGYKFCESTIYVFDILVFMKYAINYLQENPKAEIFYTLETTYDSSIPDEIYEYIEEKLQ